MIAQGTIEIVVDREQTACAGLGLRISQAGSPPATIFAGAFLPARGPFTAAFNYTEKNKKLADRHLALLLLLALARAAPERIDELGFSPGADGSLSLPAVARLSFFRSYEDSADSLPRKQEFRKSIQTYFESDPKAVVAVDSQRWTVVLDLPPSSILFADGAADAAIAWLRTLLDPAGAPAKQRISWERLPAGAQHVFGRQEELSVLTRALESARTTIAVVVGWGGAGKSTLVSHWLASMAPGYEKLARVLGWSFYTQGSRDPAAASSDLFVDEALRFFGDPNPMRGSPTERGERLARLIQAQRTVLVLDGLEPLQDPRLGTLRDPALRTLLRSLGTRMNGLCVVTTRPPWNELLDLEERTVVRIALDRLSDEAGAALLASLGARGTDEELRAVSREQHGHPLTLTLLGTFVAEARGGDLKRRAGVSLSGETSHEGKHAWRVIEEYDRWFGPGPEQAILRMVGLFDRPAPLDSIRALRREPAIAGVTDAIVGLDDDTWNRHLARLRKARLLLSDVREGAVDAHPLVREFFGALLERTNPAGFRAAHGRLFEHLRDRGKTSPDTMEDRLDDIEPLFRAIWHGANARRWQEAFDLYRARLRRNNIHFTIYQLNAISADLAAQSVFFDATGTLRPSLLTPADEAWLLSARAFSLRALGDVERARDALSLSARLHAEQGNYMDASVAEGNLNEMSTLLGDLAVAVRHCGHEIELARRSNVPFMLRLTLGHEAHLLHYQGHLADAARAYEEARAMEATCPPDYPLLALYEDVVFVQWYWEMAFDVADPAVLAAGPSRAAPPLWQVGRAFDLLVRARLSSLGGDRAAAHRQYDTAVELLRDAGERTWLATGLLARAADRVLGPDADAERDLDDVKRDLDEAVPVVEAAGMRLSRCDALLIEARRAARSGEIAAAESALASARSLVRATGYHVRDADADLVAARIAAARGDRESAEGALARARDRIEAAGYASRRAELLEIEGLHRGGT